MAPARNAAPLVRAAVHNRKRSPPRYNDRWQYQRSTCVFDGAPLQYRTRGPLPKREPFAALLTGRSRRTCGKEEQSCLSSRRGGASDAPPPKGLPFQISSARMRISKELGLPHKIARRALDFPRFEPDSHGSLFEVSNPLPEKLPEAQIQCDSIPCKLNVIRMTC